MASTLLSSWLLSLGALGHGLERPSGLELSLAVVHAVEGGPFVCRVTLTNTGTAVVRLTYGLLSDGSSCSASAPSSWGAQYSPPARSKIYSGTLGPFIKELNPGESWSRNLYLQQHYEAVRAGEVPLRFGWKVRLDGEMIKDNEFTMSHTTNVKVQPATEENLKQIVESLRGEVSQAEPDSERFEHLADVVIGSQNTALVPIAMDLLSRCPSTALRQELVAATYECCSSPDQAFAQIIGYLRSAEPTGSPAFFEHWKAQAVRHSKLQRLEELRNTNPTGPEYRLLETDRRLRAFEAGTCRPARHPDTRLTTEQLAQLRGIESAWIRALVFMSFPAECPAEWVSKLIADLKQLSRPPSPERFEQLLKDLDSLRFRTREQATADLRQSGDTGLPDLRQALFNNNLSVEQRERLKRLVADIEREPVPLMVREMLKYLRGRDTPQSRQVLEALTYNLPSARVTKEAKAALEQRKEK